MDIIDEADPKLYALHCLMTGRNTPEAQRSAMHVLAAPVPGTAKGAAATATIGEYANTEQTDAAAAGIRRAYARCSAATPLRPMIGDGGEARGFATRLRFEELPAYTQHALVLRWEDRIAILAVNAPNTVPLDEERLFNALADYTREDLGLKEDRPSHFSDATP